ncbi:MAG: murein transglycosylase A [Elusimicrobia bacterium]|nr:murein transglycosylase A [Elusimicrobiota bacterium]
MKLSLKQCAVLTALLLSACLPRPRTSGPPGQGRPAVRLVPPDQWPILQDDLDPASLAKAAERTVAYLKTLDPQKLIQAGGRSVGPQLLIDTAQALARPRPEGETPEQFTQRLKQDFDLFAVGTSTSPKAAFFSAYYQPVLKASLERTGKFQYPLYRRPPDMLEADLGAFNPKWKGEGVVGRAQERRFVPYFDRREIDARKVLEGKSLELAWLETQFDRLDLHIEGSGLLEFPDGALRMARYAATNALPYKSVGLAVVGAGAMTREEISHETLRQYLQDHPEGESWLISQNPRYTFFELVETPPDGEPLGRISQPLMAGRSIAVDPRFTPLGAAVFMRLDLAQTDESGRLLGKAKASRFAFCQDVGGAITGAGRVDIYVGHGPQAKGLAPRIWEPGELYLLLKKLPPRQR